MPRRPKYSIKKSKLIIKLASEGYIDKEIAKEVGIVPSTLYSWLNKHPELRKSVDEVKLEYDTREVELVLKKSMLGKVTVTETRHEFDEYGSPKMVGMVTKEIPPNAALIQFWLRNRGGYDDVRNIKVKSDPISKMTDAELDNELKELDSADGQ